MITKALQAHLERIKNPKHVFTKAEINALSKAVCRARWEKCPEAKEFRLNLLDEIYLKSFKITPEQSKFGIEWLNRLLFNAKGELRKSKEALHFGEYRAKIVRKFKHFRFIGYDAFLNNYDGQVTALVPAYEVIAKNGESFIYAAQHWGNIHLDNEIQFGR